MRKGQRQSILVYLRVDKVDVLSIVPAECGHASLELAFKNYLILAMLKPYDKRQDKTSPIPLPTQQITVHFRGR